MVRSRKKRSSLSLRLQPYEGNVLAEVIDYLNTLPRDEMSQKLSDILVAALLPVARYASGNYTSDQLRMTCWECQDSLNKHSSNMRLALGVEQPQFVLPYQVTPQRAKITTDGNAAVPNVLTTQNVDRNEEFEFEQRPAPSIEGFSSSQNLDSLFGDD